MVITVSALMADYTTFVTTSVTGAKGAEKEIFFGTLADYSQANAEIAKSIKAHGGMGAINGMSTGAQSLAKGFFGEGMKSVGTGALIGVIVGLMDPFIMDFYADQQYVLIRAIDLDNGKKALKAITFIGDKNPSLSEEEIHNVLKEK